jgi:oxygen-independent coproporphyrinogen-3 oxidase
MLTKNLGDAGYEHYEISNFAKPGFRSKHNSSYWEGVPYYGFGPSAHSYNGKVRRWNVANNSLYTSSIKKNIIPYEEELLTETQQFNEYIMTSLRTLEGISLKKVRDHFGNYAEALALRSAKHLKHELMISINDHLLLTSNGKFLADGIAADLFA